MEGSLGRVLVELLYWDGCPSHPAALEDLRDAMARAGLDPDAVVVREVPTEVAAREADFPGSPTIRVDGRDIVDSADEPRGLVCRVYRRRDGRISPTPDPQDILEALTR